MRHLLLGLAVLTVQAQPSARLEDLAWISGAWTGSAGAALFEETWSAPKAGIMVGTSRTTVRGRLAGFEFLRIEQRPDGIFYVAQPQGRPPTSFKLTSSTPNRAVFENPEHDHPKIITYRIDGDTLTASIEGDEKGKHKKAEFRFQRAGAQRP